MIGRARLRNLRDLVATAISEGVPGDLIETGVWRGGACILMRAALEAFGDLGRRVFVADSSEGLPAPDAQAYPADLGDKHHTIEELSISLDEVKANFAKYGLLDNRVVFLKGWFKDTLRAAPIERLAVLRLDGDMYESTTDALTALYDKVSPGGFVIVDDYGCIEACRRAVHDFRDARGIVDPIVDIDGWGVYWRKSLEAAVPRLAPVLTPAARPFWSVVVPLYNRKTYLKQCLDSVLEQDPGPDDMEIIVVDDASPTDLSGLVREAGRGRVRYLRNASNLGLYPSTNAAIESDHRPVHPHPARRRLGRERLLPQDARGDRSLSRRRWRRVLPVRDILRALGREVVACAVSRGDRSFMDRNFLFRLATGCPLNLPAVVFARKAFEQVGLFRTDLPMMADWEWYVRSALQLNWLHLPERLATWRVDHQHQLTGQLVESFAAHLDFRRTLEIFARTLPQGVAAAVLPEARILRTRDAISAGAAECLRNGRVDLARRNVWEAFALGEAAAGPAGIHRTHPPSRCLDGCGRKFATAGSPPSARQPVSRGAPRPGFPWYVRGPMDWDNVRVFLAVARGGQFVAAAKRLKLDHATVSRRIAALESTVGAKLFDRRTTGAKLTCAGERFIGAAEQMESAFLHAQGEISGVDLELSGDVRIGAPDGFSTYYLTQALRDFAERHPGVRLQLMPLPQLTPLAQREVDIVVGLDKPEAGRFVARKLTDYTLGIYAERRLPQAQRRAL